MSALWVSLGLLRLKPGTEVSCTAPQLCCVGGKGHHLPTPSEKWAIHLLTLGHMALLSHPGSQAGQQSLENLTQTHLNNGPSVHIHRAPTTSSFKLGQWEKKIPTVERSKSNLCSYELLDYYLGSLYLW